MTTAASQPAARAEPAREGDTLVVRLGGGWQMTAAWPAWGKLVAGSPPARVRLQGDELGAWDSSLALFIRDARAWCEANGAALELVDLPAGADRLAQELAKKPVKPPVQPHGLPDLFAFVGKATFKTWGEIKDIAWLVGECSFSALRFVRGRAQFRWSDCLVEMQECGAMVLPIVGLISFLVGIIMAYQGAVQLRQFGADVYVADLVGLSVVREMGPMMAAIVLAGRTGAAFAATLATMKANEEIDALETLGVTPIDFLVMPRLTALFIMMPLLAVYSNFLGILGGMVISWSILDIPTSLYWAETKSIIDLSDLSTGLIKAATFGLIIGLSGCLRGLKSDRSAAGVGQAATSAVVTGILLIIVSDAVYAVIFNALGW
jgi:phospholipid/cholesterol/gamma-HCH transport system permease protein